MKRKALAAIVYLLFFVCMDRLNAEQFQYDAHGKRDPMVPLVGQDRPSASVGFAEIASIDDVRLEGIAALASGSKTAIINGELVKEGLKSGEVEVKMITKNSVVLNIGGTEYTINLIEEGGQI
jgi:hypothetical protein